VPRCLMSMVQCAQHCHWPAWGLGTKLSRSACPVVIVGMESTLHAIDLHKHGVTCPNDRVLTKKTVHICVCVWILVSSY
jgi:hypothetical protein